MSTPKRLILAKRKNDAFLPPPGCPLIFPKDPIKPSDLLPSGVIKAKVYNYVTKSDGIKHIYTNEDALWEYGSSVILNPIKTSYFNLFINGVLQPERLYHLEEGKLILNAGEIPLKDSPIILQFVVIRITDVE